MHLPMHGYVLSHRNDKRGSDTNVFANREVGGGFMLLRCMLQGDARRGCHE